MKAIVYREYGPPEVLHLEEIEKPTPEDNEVLIKVYATTVTSGDYKMRNSPVSLRIMALLFGFNFGLTKPKNPLLGSEIAGEIESVGKDVKAFNEGDQVYGINGDNPGTYTEYVCMLEEAPVTTKPANMTFEEAASIPFGAHTALHFLRDKANIQNGQKVLVYGASGSVGTAAVQLAKYYGAEVTAVCSTANIDLMKSLGADKVIDYTKEDFSKNGQTFDIIYETVGKSSISDGMNSLDENGIYLAGNAGMLSMIKMALTSMRGSKKALFGVAPEHKEDLIFLRELVEEGKLKPVIDRTYPLEQTADAHRYAEQGHKKGNVVLTVEHNDLT